MQNSLQGGNRESPIDCAILFLCPENSKALCQLLSLPEPQRSRNGARNCWKEREGAGWTVPGNHGHCRGVRGWQLCPHPDAHPQAAALTGLHSLWKGSAFPMSRHESVCFLSPHSHSPLASAGVLAPSFCIPLAYCFSNELFTVVSSSLAGVWAGTGTDMLERQGAVRWARAGCWGKSSRGDETSSLHLWSDTETSLSEKVGCLFKTGKGGKDLLPVCRGLLVEGSLGAQDGLTRGAPQTPSRTSYRHHSCGAPCSHPGWSLQPRLSLREGCHCNRSARNQAQLPHRILVFLSHSVLRAQAWSLPHALSILTAHYR